VARGGGDSRIPNQSPSGSEAQQVSLLLLEVGQCGGAITLSCTRLPFAVYALLALGELA
jgi:hypothetical protein